MKMKNQQNSKLLKFSRESKTGNIFLFTMTMNDDMKQQLMNDNEIVSMIIERLSFLIFSIFYIFNYYFYFPRKSSIEVDAIEVLS